MDLSDEHLVQCARNGDKDAFGQLVVRHYETVCQLANRLVRDEDMTRQLVQEAVLQAYLSLDRLQKDAAFKSWLCGIALNLCRQHIRKNERHDDWMVLALGDVQDPGPDPYLVLEAREFHRQVIEAVQGLPAHMQETVMLFYFEQFSLREVAAALDVTIGTVKQQLHRARERLKVPLQSVYETYLLDQRKDTMESLKIAAVYYGVDKNSFVVLVDESQEHKVSVPVDPVSAQGIMLALSDQVSFDAHDFSFRLMDALDAELESMELSLLPENIIVAELILRQGKRTKRLNTRAGEALVLAAQTGASILVEQDVLTDVDLQLPHADVSQLAVPVALSDDAVKGKVVGKNGRNIITFEALTGAKLIVNAAPRVVYVVCDDDQKRAVAVRAISQLVAGERINPELVADAVQKAQEGVATGISEDCVSLSVPFFFILPEQGRIRPVVVDVPDETMKNRLIGDEGRNARVFETATGAHLFMTDAIPNKVVAWSSDMDKLAVAKMSLERIVGDEQFDSEAIVEIVSACKTRHYLGV